VRSARCNQDWMGLGFSGIRPRVPEGKTRQSEAPQTKDNGKSRIERKKRTLGPLPRALQTMKTDDVGRESRVFIAARL
jgi:hypothetical protein